MSGTTTIESFCFFKNIIIYFNLKADEDDDKLD